MFLASDWTDYEVLDCGGGEKLERWQNVILRRPDPQAIWPARNKELWKSVDAHSHRSEKGGGIWEFMRTLPERWTVSYRDLTLYVRPTGFKHTGLFPEQAANWDWMRSRIESRVREGSSVEVLNLFGYTGGATMACARAGAGVTHVHAAKGWSSGPERTRPCVICRRRAPGGSWMVPRNLWNGKSGADISMMLS